MDDKGKKVYWQCVYTGKVYNSEEEALKNCEGPIQPFIKNHDKWPKRGFFGTVTWRKKK